MPSCTSVNIFKSPQSGVTLCFQFVSAAGAGAAAATMTFASHVKAVWARQRKYGFGKMYWVTFGWPWLKVTTVTLINKNLLVCRIKWVPLNQSLQNFAAITLWSWSSPDYIWKNAVGNPFFAKFSSKILDVFLQGQTLYWTQEWLVRLMWNEKEVHRWDTGWTMWPWPLTSPMTLTFDFSRSNFKIAVSEELLSDWCETKKSKSVRYWAD